MALKVGSRGNPNARVMIVGEAPGRDEEIANSPFVGASGKELDKQLREAGISLEECYFTNVCKYRPPDNDMSKWITTTKTDVKKQGYVEFNGRYANPVVLAGLAELREEIATVKPELVIGLGNTPLWALTGNYGISAWRGSEMVLADGPRFVPTLHPAAILRNFAARPAVMHDLRQRCAKRLKHGFVDPQFNFLLSPTFDEVINTIRNLEGDVVGDIETAKGRTICLGLSWSTKDAICIPFWNLDGVSWSVDEQRAIFDELEKKREQITWGGQNWSYDAQYIEEDFQKLILQDFDTYVAQTVLFPGVERSLGYLSSMYCEWHQYWKEDAKDWGRIADFNGLFTYNCRDCCANWEVIQVQRKLLEANKLMPQFEERMKYTTKHVYPMMRNGFHRDPERVKAMITAVDEKVHENELFVAEKAGHPVNFDSPKQVQKLFYTELGCKVQKKRGKGTITTDDEALKKVAELHPEHAALTEAILESRTLSKLKSTYLEAEDDPDGKYRSSWMATGTETFRCSSSGNAFHRGGPVQNITGGVTHSGRKVPNLRTTIVPSPGHTIFNCDLERADLQVVIWEADDAEMKQMMREHVDIHTENAKAIFGLNREPTYAERQFGKTFVHLTNYGGSARTCAVKVHCTVHEAEMAQKRWFGAHPGIKKWHERTNANLLAFRTVTNRFGYRMIFFDRVEGLLPEALAWLPQSTVSILISLQQMAIDEACAPLGLRHIMQVHDSVVGEYETSKEGIILPKLHAASKIAIPYPDPLYIPLELATSTSSWGEVEKRPWPTV